MQYNKLYKKTTTDKTQEWSIYVEGNTYYTIHGQEGGKLITSAKTTCIEKNIGKTNATTAEEQALAEVEAIYKDKLASGYSTDNINVTKAAFFEPMLAHEYNKMAAKKGKVSWPMFTQPKLDGIRCIAHADGSLFSREGKPIVSCPHIAEAVKNLHLPAGAVLDGELYNHDLKDDFNLLVSHIRKTKPTLVDTVLCEKIIQYHVYDCCHEKDELFVTRLEKLRSYITIDTTSYCIKLVSTLVALDFETFKNINSTHLSSGYEGSILRANIAYENKRSNGLLKYKEFTDDEFKVVDVLEGIGNRANMAGKIVILLNDGTTCEAGIKGGFAWYKKLLEDKSNVIGKMITVTYFGTTPYGKLRFPVAKTIRDYE